MSNCSCCKQSSLSLLRQVPCKHMTCIMCATAVCKGTCPTCRQPARKYGTCSCCGLENSSLHCVPGDLHALCVNCYEYDGCRVFNYPEPASHSNNNQTQSNSAHEIPLLIEHDAERRIGSITSSASSTMDGQFWVLSILNNASRLIFDEPDHDLEVATQNGLVDTVQVNASPHVTTKQIDTSGHLPIDTAIFDPKYDQPLPEIADTKPSQQPKQFICCVCMSNYVCVVFSSCKHECVCIGCLLELNKPSSSSSHLECPICKSVVTSIERAYH